MSLPLIDANSLEMALGIIDDEVASRFICFSRPVVEVVEPVDVVFLLNSSTEVVAFCEAFSSITNSSGGSKRGEDVLSTLSLCSTCFPSSPSRYALGVDERCGKRIASQWQTIRPLRLRLHQQFALSSFALSH
jgi:hypothetical protein